MADQRTVLDHYNELVRSCEDSELLHPDALYDVDADAQARCGVSFQALKAQAREI